MIIDELRLTKRNVVTIAALKLPDLAEYLHVKHDDTFDCCVRRIRILSVREVPDFWLFPSKDLDLE